jgi:homoserine dehydrogenase
MFAAIATKMAAEGISLESIVQRARAPRADAAAVAPAAPQPVRMITYETTEKAIRAALDTVRAEGLVAEAPRFIRIETH